VATRHSGKYGVVTEAAVLSAVLLHVGSWGGFEPSDMVSGLPANGYPIVILAGSCDLAAGSWTEPKPLVIGMKGPR
jgi:hypothetical protein